METNKFKILLVIFLISINLANCQQNKNMQYDDLKLELAKFFVKNKSIESLSDFNNKPSIINLSGVHNDYKKSNLINGVYSFSLNRTHEKAFFVIVENESFIILDVSNKNGLIKSIENTLEYGERNNFCQSIIKDYVNRLLGVYYNINKDLSRRGDINCEIGINNTDDLP